MGAIKPKYGDCSKCPKTNVLLYRVHPPECKGCYERLKAEKQREKQKQKPKKIEVKTVKKINPVSKINTIVTSIGERMSRAEFDERIRKAKAKKLQLMLEQHGYIFCEDCKRNDCKPIDCSHDKSVKACIEGGVSELAYDVNNITMRGRRCHNLHDKTY